MPPVEYRTRFIDARQMVARAPCIGLSICAEPFSAAKDMV